MSERERFVAEYGVSEYDASLLVPNHDMADYFESVAKASGTSKLAANWILGDLSAALNRHELGITESPISAERLGGLISRIEDGTLSSKLAKQVFDALWEGEGDADQIIAARGLKQVSDSSALEAMVTEVIANNPDQVAQYIAADEAKRKKLSGFFVGQIMKASKGQANPQMINQLLLEKLESQS